MKVHLRKGKCLAPMVLLLVIVKIVLAQFPELPKPPVDITKRGW